MIQPSPRRFVSSIGRRHLQRQSCAYGRASSTGSAVYTGGRRGKQSQNSVSPCAQITLMGRPFGDGFKLEVAAEAAHSGGGLQAIPPRGADELAGALAGTAHKRNIALMRASTPSNLLFQ